MSETKECPLCGSMASMTPEGTSDRARNIYRFECNACGQFVMNRFDHKDKLNEYEREELHTGRMSILTREQTIVGPPWLYLQFQETPYPLAHDTLPVNYYTYLRDRWPNTIPERLERALCNLAQFSKIAGELIDIPQNDPRLFFSTDVTEGVFIRDALIELGLITKRKNSDRAFVTADGWGRVAELAHTSSVPTNPVFVAMWFGETDPDKEQQMKLYDEAIKPAIEDAGYKATRVDLVHHNDFIMNRILGDIRIAPFVVADFKGHRQGVYFEAGFARGLGIPIVNTCPEQEIKDAHFDTKQLNHVLWKNPGDLYVKLREHIRGSIGEGPFEDQIKRGDES